MSTQNANGSWAARSVHHWSIAALLNGNVSSPLSAPGLPTKSVSVSGTFGAGGSLNIEGSNDGGTTYNVLKDLGGNALTFTASAGLLEIRETPLFIRANVTAGDGTTSLNVDIVSTKAR